MFERSVTRTPPSFALRATLSNVTQSRWVRCAQIDVDFTIGLIRYFRQSLATPTLVRTTAALAFGFARARLTHACPPSEPRKNTRPIHPRCCAPESSNAQRKRIFLKNHF